MPESANAATLEDVMVAMDVVDTLRHQQDIAERELDDEGRRQRLLHRLKDLYKAQGIEVPDSVLNEGIEALEQERFKYQAIEPSWRTKLAHVWVSRRTWGKPVGFLSVLGGLFWGVYFATDVLPERRLTSQLPEQSQQLFEQIRTSAENQAVVLDAQRQVNAVKSAVQEQRLGDAKAIVAELESVQSLLQTHYRVRVVSRAGQQSGVWRIPDVNDSARNYYLIVEAIDDQNRVVELDIVSEESNQSKRVKTWGLRVNEQAFNQVANDKRDDGIIQNNIVGEKPVGRLKPNFSIATTGGTITEW